MYVCMYVCMYVSMYVCMYVYIHIHIHIHINIYIHTGQGRDSVHTEGACVSTCEGQTVETCRLEHARARALSGLLVPLRAPCHPSKTKPHTCLLAWCALAVYVHVSHINASRSKSVCVCARAYTQNRRARVPDRVLRATLLSLDKVTGHSEGLIPAHQRSPFSRQPLRHASPRCTSVCGVCPGARAAGNAARACVGRARCWAARVQGAGPMYSSSNCNMYTSFS